MSVCWRKGRSQQTFLPRNAEVWSCVLQELLEYKNVAQQIEDMVIVKNTRWCLFKIHGTTLLKLCN